MTVTLREIRRLQDKVAEEIKELKENPDADYDRLAELRTLSFNISMVFLRYSMEKDSTEVELGPADTKIVSMCAFAWLTHKIAYFDLNNSC